MCQQTFPCRHKCKKQKKKMIVNKLPAAACGVNSRRVKDDDDDGEIRTTLTPMTALRVLCTELFREKKIHV